MNSSSLFLSKFRIFICSIISSIEKLFTWLKPSFVRVWNGKQLFMHLAQKKFLSLFTLFLGLLHLAWHCLWHSWQVSKICLLQHVCLQKLHFLFINTWDGVTQGGREQTAEFPLHNNNSHESWNWKEITRARNLDNCRVSHW